MKLSAEQLELHLNKTLSPYYLISGDEVLLVNEAIELIVLKAKQQGFIEHAKFDASLPTQWEQFIAELSTRSLFSEKQILECQLPTKFPEQGKKELFRVIEQKQKDKILIFVTGKLSPQQQTSDWYRIIETNGTAITVWPINAKQFPLWLKKRFIQSGFIIDDGLLPLIAEYFAGNLLAAQQYIEKLSLLFPKGKLIEKDLMSSLTSHTRYTVFDLIDAIKLKKVKLIIQISTCLEAEKIEPSIVLWAIAREARLQKQDYLYPFLEKIDHLIKGVIVGNPWQLIQQVSLMMIGKPLFKDTNKLLSLI